MNRALSPSNLRSVRTLLHWLVLGCLLPGIIGALVLLVYEYRQNQAQLERDTLQTARALTQAVDIEIHGVQRLGQGLATAAMIANGDLAGFHRQARRTLAASGLESTISLSDRRGQLVVNTAAEFGTPLPMNGNPDLVRRVFETRMPVVSRLFRSAVTGRHLMAVGVPVIVNGTVIYALTVSIHSEQFNAILNSQRLPEGWVVTVFDGDGIIVARSRDAERFAGQPPADNYLARLLQSDEGHFDATMKDGVPAFVSHARSPVTGWRVAVNIPEEALVAELVSHLSALALGIAAVFTIGFVLARAMSERIARSFQALVAPAAALGAGQAVSLPRTDIREAAELATAMGETARLLQERTAALEARERDLAERSSALRQSEIRLQTLTEHAPAAIAVFDRDMRYLAVSRRWLADHRLEGKKVIGVSHYAVVPDLPEAWRRAHRRGLAGEVLCADADRFVRADGSVQWMRWEIWPWRDESGAVGGIIIAVEEVTGRVVAEQRLRESESRLALALKAADTAVWELDVATEKIVPADERFFAMLDCSAKELGTAAQWLGRMHEQDRQGVPDMINDVIEGRCESFSAEVRIRDSGGNWRWILCQATAAGRDADGRAVRLVGTHTNIDARKRAEQRAREAALHDPLTGLPNRALVFEYGGHLLAAAQRNHAQGALLFIDLDRFKPINDIYGHDVGDRVLQEVSARLLACTRQEDVVGRLGGDEFVIILPHLAPDLHRAATVAQHVIDSISRPVVIDTLELSLSPSIGISFYPEHATDVGALIHTADLAMYQAKQAGPGHYQIYTPELDRRAGEAYSLEARLKNALKRGRLELHYQPVVDIRSGALIGAEALVRLADDEPQAVGPQTFIPIAESAGLIGDLGAWVMTEACRQHKAWRAEGLQVPIAVNVSPLQFREKGFADKLSRIILDTGVDPGCIQLEVTESAVMQNLDEAVAILHRIKSLGVKVSLDDFGTGYSSLSHLSSLPLDKLKVDQSFVQRIGSDQASRAVTEAIIALGRSLKLEVIGEGIENEEALRYLQEHGCDQAQGYWFSRPLCATEFAKWCRWQRGATQAALPAGSRR